MVSRYIATKISLHNFVSNSIHKAIHNRHNATTMHRYIISIQRYNANNIFFKYFMKKCIVVALWRLCIALCVEFCFKLCIEKKWRAIQNYICSVVIFVDTLGTCNFCCIYNYKKNTGGIRKKLSRTKTGQEQNEMEKKSENNL